MSRDDVFGSWSKRYTLNPGTILKVPAISGQNAVSVKLVSGGTLEIGGSTLTGQTFGDMYYVSANEVVSFNMSGAFYLWSSGATCIAAVLRARSAGTEDVAP